MRTQTDDAQLLLPGEVAALFRVGVATVNRWARTGQLPTVRTPSGRSRFPADAIHQLLEEHQ